MSNATLNRTTFRTSREMDFFSEKELTTQTGHSIFEWPLVIIKELLDNSLDACEEADIPPEITVKTDATGITVKDNGPGIPDDTIKGALDFKVRTSNREQYIAPDRGAQGNALMTMLSMPYVIDREHGRLILTAHGVQHEIVCRADPISQRANVEDVTTDVDDEPGTEVRIEWKEAIDDDGDVVWPFGDESWPTYQPTYDEEPTTSDLFLRLIRGYTFFNPHLTMTFDWFGETTHTKATDPSWQKWKPNKPTSAHWYELRHLERLIAAYITHDRDNGADRTVAAFVREFDGLSGTKKRKLVLEETGLARVNLSALATDGGLDHDVIAKLLASMKNNAKEVKPARLGIIGEKHFATRLEEMGGDPKQFEYAKVARVDDGLPFVLESAFSWLGDDAPDERQLFAGANWSSAIRNPFRSFGQTGEGLEAQLTDLRAGAGEPIVFMLHLAHPRVEYTDRGKSAIVIADAGDQKESA